jgi:MFS transporter, ACS family, tartrate transporter
LFQPQIVHRLAAGFGMTGIINAIPYVFAAGAMVLWGRHSDHTGERPRHVAIAGSVTSRAVCDEARCLNALIMRSA